MLERPARVSVPSLGSVLLLLPALFVSLVFFVIPMVTVAAYSLSTPGPEGARFTLENYVTVVTDEFYWEVLLRTLYLSLGATLAALVVSYPAALILFFSDSRWRRVFLFIIISPLFISVIVRTYGWIVLLSPNGAINWLLPADFQVRLLQTRSAIVIGLTHIYIPFMVLALNSALFKIDKRLLTAASTLGASKLRAFRDIIVPLSLPGVIAGSVLVFSISMTSFTTPVLLGGARNKTMAYLIYQQNLLASDWYVGSTLALFLLAVTLTVTAAITLLNRTLSSEG
jgi:putative spermidine/putrescine transport system permease protein